MERQFIEKVIIKAEEAKKYSTEELFAKLATAVVGLNAAEARERQKQYGPNALIEKKSSPLLKFLSYFWGPIPWMIEVAALLSAAIRHLEDFAIITMLLLINAGVGFWQEYKANNAIEMLKHNLALNARVRRGGSWLDLPASELVPGDIVMIRPGNIVPADVKLIDGEYLSADESALTGESLPVEKKGGDLAYSGSIVRQGEMNALVFATGMKTYFGKTAQLVDETNTRSHFQKAIIKIGDYLILLAVILATIILIVALFRHDSLIETLKFALVLMVAAIPVAMPAVLSVAMAVGSIALAKQKAIVSNLASIEEMAGIDVLCADKTGTITKNEISVAETHVFEGHDDIELLLLGVLASKAENNDLVDLAIIGQAMKNKAVADSLSKYHQDKFKPFDPVNKRTEAEITSGGSTFKVIKGAPQVVLALVTKKDGLETKTNEVIDAFAARGYRALGVARTDGLTDDWQFIGLIALSDPPRDDSAETIKAAQAMGVAVKMITGDNLAVAKQIARQVNLGSNIVTPAALLDKSDLEAKEVIEKADGFAEVFPEHKHRIVTLLQAYGHIVGMTGDGVNDAPAIKKADAGIAVAGATDAAKAAADMILTMPGLSVIIRAIKESRKIFQRMTNYAIYRIAETIRLILFITISIIVFNFYPVTALMIVLLALLNDAPIMTIAFDNVNYSDQPEKWDMAAILRIAAVLGIIGVVSSFFIFFIGQEVLHLSREVLQSFIYLKLSVAGHLTVFVARTKGPFWSVRPARPLFLAIILTQLIATLIVVYGFLLSPMGWGLAFFVWGYCLIAFLLTDLIKVFIYRMFDSIGQK